MSTTREFPTLDVITVATGTLVSDRLMDAVYDTLNWLLDDNLFTHQLPAASRAAEQHIYAQHPWIADLDLPAGDLPALKAECARIVEEHGDTLTLERPTHVAWVTENALADLLDIAGNRPVIVVRAPEAGDTK